MLGLLLATETSRAETNPKRVYQRSLPSVMTLDVENKAGERFIGSAVLALSNDVAVTAWHVVSDAHTVWASFADGTRVQVLGYLDRDCQRDVALLKLERPLRGRKAMVSADLMPVGSRAYVIGAPKGLGFSISDGLVSQLRMVDGFAQYQVSCPISPGNSGGPMLNEHGQVAGIVSWTKSDAQNVSFAIPCQEILRLTPSSQLVRWDDSAQRIAGPAPQRKLQSELPVLKTRGDNFSGGYRDFTNQLERLAGKAVTVVLRSNGQDNKFTFVVPAGAGH